MLFLRRPSASAVRSVLEGSRGGRFSYPEVGASRDLKGALEAPRGYNVDHNRVRLGEGEALFERAAAALRRWEEFRLGWLTLFSPDAPIEVGVELGVLVDVLGIWSLNINRIVYTLDERAGGARRFGFAYGTLEEHAERGEERFTVELREADESVHYEILAFSRPNQVYSKAAYPLTRALQRRFAAGSLRAMAASLKGA